MEYSRKELILHIYDLLLKKFGHRDWWPADSPFEVIIGAILTQNTAWTNVEKAISNLKRSNVLSPVKIQALTLPELAMLIKPSGFYNQKAKRLKEVVGYLNDHYNGLVDNMCEKDSHTLREELLSIKGIGKETADSIILYACSKPVFVVDSYTHRVFFRHGMIEEQMEYDEIQEMFMDNLNHEYKMFNEYHALIVEVAKNYCRTKPLCEGCPLSELSGHIV